MSLNEEGNFINKISKMSEEELVNLDLQVYLVSKAPESDDLFFSKREHLQSELRNWLKKQIKRELNKIKVGEGTEKRFYISEYNHELTKRDYIARLRINSDDQLLTKKGKLIDSLNYEHSDFVDKKANFQVIKLSLENEIAYFLYYRGVKVSATERKNISRIPAVRDRHQLVIQNKDVIEFGGKIELFVHGSYMYILNPRTLEYAFNYDDHITKKRDENLTRITSMSFFDEHSNIEEFKDTSSQYILSRSLASIKEETLEALEDSFEERCRELKEIKERIPTQEEEKEEYIQKYESLWPLYHHLDIQDQKVRFNPDYDVIPLLHFFSDKIVESFLTKKIKSETY